MTSDFLGRSPADKRDGRARIPHFLAIGEAH